MKILRFLLSPVAMGGLFIIFAVSMSIATFIENDYGSGAAYSMVYDTKWFELILILLAVNLTGQLILLKLFRKSRLPIALFHLSFVLMIIGAGITRYMGWEGMIHIREGETQNICYSGEKYIGFSVKDDKGSVLTSYSRKYSMTSATAENFRKKINAAGKNYKLVLTRIIPNAAESITDMPGGEPVVSMYMTTSMNSGETFIVRKGETRTILGVSVGFEAGANTDLKIFIDSSKFFMVSDKPVSQINMMTRESTVLQPGTKMELKQMQVSTLNGVRIVPQQMSLSGMVRATSVSTDIEKTGQNAFIFSLTSGENQETISLWDRESENVAAGECSMDGLKFEITYGSKPVELPFSLKLDDFVLDRYPGSSSPSGYKSNVILADREKNLEKPFSIYMNNILKYNGYRFYQSSYDPDEKGTILAVNHDRAGMVVTYSGYALLFLFIVLSLLSRNSFFRNVKPAAWPSAVRKAVTIVSLMFLLQGFSVVRAQKFVPSGEGAEEFGKVLVQDQKGRTKPLYTVSSDILRKVTKKSRFEGYSPMQVFLGLYFDFDHWKEVPLIKVSDSKLREEIGIVGSYAAFSDIVDLTGEGTYKLSADVNTAYSKPPSDRNKTDKEAMKVDERVNIVYMIYKGDFMKMFPLKDGSHNWGTAEESVKNSTSREDSVYLAEIIPALVNALDTGDKIKVRKIAESVNGYQARFTEYSLPSATKTNAEVLYYKMGIFEKLFPFYATAGLVMLIGLIIIVIKGRAGSPFFIRLLWWVLFTGFVFHTFGLGLRWYIAGHSPMSNGYESMIFISWVTLLAGFIFSRKSPFALSATAVLAGMTLMVAHLSFMDPEITNLVPVLKSYWLTLHVSVITGSYGFLGLGALLGIVNMILFSLINNDNRERISGTIDELTVINFRTLTLGLYFLTIGTFLGAVWANESWGRYWGWDPKETWSLITIIVYTFVTHSRMIPGLKDIYTFNLLSIFGFSSVLMTYFGVNYYLSGLHSYASGDPVPVPSFVYIAVALLVAISVTAWLKYRKTEVKELN